MSVSDSPPLAPVVQELKDFYGPLITFREAAKIGSVSIKTVYDWSTCGLLGGFKVGKGRRTRLIRDKYVQFLMNA